MLTCQATGLHVNVVIPSACDPNPRQGYMSCNLDVLVQDLTVFDPV